MNKKTKMPSNWAINFVPCDEIKEKLYSEGRGNYRLIINEALKLYYAV